MNLQIVGGLTRKILTKDKFSFDGYFAGSQVLAIEQKDKNAGSLTVKFKKGSTAAASTTSNASTTAGTTNTASSTNTAGTASSAQTTTGDQKGTISLAVGTLMYTADSSKVDYAVTQTLFIPAAPSSSATSSQLGIGLLNTFEGIGNKVKDVAESQVKSGISSAVGKGMTALGGVIKSAIGFNPLDIFNSLTGINLTEKISTGITDLLNLKDKASAAPKMALDENAMKTSEKELIENGLSKQDMNNYMTSFNSLCASLYGNQYQVKNDLGIAAANDFFEKTKADPDGSLSNVDLESIENQFRIVYCASSSKGSDTSYLGEYNTFLAKVNGKNFLGAEDAGSFANQDIFKAYEVMESVSHDFNNETFDNREQFNTSVKKFVDQGYYVLSSAIMYNITYNQVHEKDAKAKLDADPSNQELQIQYKDYVDSGKIAETHMENLQANYDEFQLLYELARQKLAAEKNVWDGGQGEAKAYCYATKTWYYKNMKGTNPNMDDGYNASAGVLNPDGSFRSYYIGARGTGWFRSHDKHLIIQACCSQYYFTNSKYFWEDSKHTGSIFTQLPSTANFQGLIKMTQNEGTTLEASLMNAGFTVNGTDYQTYKNGNGSNYKGIYIKTQNGYDQLGWFTRTMAFFLPGIFDKYSRTTNYVDTAGREQMTRTMYLQMFNYDSLAVVYRTGDGNDSYVDTAGNSSKDDRLQGLNMNLLTKEQAQSLYDDPENAQITDCLNVIDSNKAKALFAQMKAEGKKNNNGNDLNLKDFWTDTEEDKYVKEQVEAPAKLDLDRNLQMACLRQVPGNDIPSLSMDFSYKK